MSMEGAPTPITAFFAVAPKVAAVALFLRVMMSPFGGLISEWQQVIIVVSIASMVLGAFAAIWQDNIKRLNGLQFDRPHGLCARGPRIGNRRGDARHDHLHDDISRHEHRDVCRDSQHEACGDYG